MPAGLCNSCYHLVLKNYGTTLICNGTNLHFRTYSSWADSASGFAQLDLALNVELHLVRELERLEEGVGEHGGAGALGVLGGDERVGEELGLEGAAVDVGQFDALFAVSSVRHALADAHVKVCVAVHSHHQGHRLADLHQAVGGGGERSTSNLENSIVKFKSLFC